MRFVFDAQLPPAPAEWLRSHGHDAVGVREIGLRHAEDSTIKDWAIRYGAIIVTKDEDFARDAIGRLGGPQVLWVRTGNVVYRVLLAQFTRAWREIEAHLVSGAPIVELR